MGLRLFGNSLGRRQSNNYHPTDPRPDKFIIKSLEQIGMCVLGVVKYPHATNFEGDKILVWYQTNVNAVRQMDLIDPHFMEDNKIIARFRPTKFGMKFARQFCESML